MMTHAEFVSACRSGATSFHVDPALAKRHISARLLLPLVRLPLLGAGVALALALIGWMWSGLAMIAAGVLLPWLAVRAAPQLILDEALASEARFAEFIASGLLKFDA